MHVCKSELVSYLRWRSSETKGKQVFLKKKKLARCALQQYVLKWQDGPACHSGGYKLVSRYFLCAQVTALQIERVIGLSAPNSRTVCFCPSEADLLCYPAGSFAVVFNTATRQQLQLLRSTTSNNPLKCVCWSTNGDYIAAGEDAANASVFVWCLDSGKCMQELKAHRQSVASLCFSLDGRYQQSETTTLLFNQGRSATAFSSVMM